VNNYAVDLKTQEKYELISLNHYRDSQDRYGDIEMIVKREDRVIITIEFTKLPIDLPRFKINLDNKEFQI
jgi:hypothetical protein